MVTGDFACIGVNSGTFSHQIKSLNKSREAAMTKAVIFDLDGTLWDASRSVTDSFNIALEDMGIERRITLEEMRSQMGKTLEEIAHVFFDCVDPERAVEIMVNCTNFENSYILTHGGVLYPNLRPTLESLRAQGLGVICVSNCQSGYIEAFIGYHKLADLFDDTECWGNTGRMKADNIKAVVQRNHIEKAVYVGDTMGDYTSAKDAGAGFIHAAYGYGSVPAGTPSIDALEKLPAVLSPFFGGEY